MTTSCRTATGVIRPRASCPCKPRHRWPHRESAAAGLPASGSRKRVVAALPWLPTAVRTGLGGSTRWGGCVDAGDRTGNFAQFGITRSIATLYTAWHSPSRYGLTVAKCEVATSTGSRCEGRPIARRRVVGAPRGRADLVKHASFHEADAVRIHSWDHLPLKLRQELPGKPSDLGGRRNKMRAPGAAAPSRGRQEWNGVTATRVCPGRRTAFAEMSDTVARAGEEALAG